MSAKKTKPKPRQIVFRFNQRYTLALGAFIEAFALVETQLFLFLARSSGLNIKLARALLTGATVDASIDFIRRIWKVYPPIPAIHEEMEDSLARLKVLHDMRNNIVHRFTLQTSDRGTVTTNYLKALTQDAVREHPVTWQILFQMSDDLFKILDHMQSLLEAPTALLADRAKAYPDLLAAWRYIPPQDQTLKSQQPWSPDQIARP